MLTLAVLIARPVQPTTAREGSRSPQQVTSKVVKSVLTGDQAREFLRLQKEKNAKLTDRWAKPKVHHSPGLSNLRVTSIKRSETRPSLGLFARLGALFADSVVEARTPRFEDCEEFFEVVQKTIPAAAPILRRVSERRTECAVEEINYYQDMFESGAHAYGTVGMSSGVEFLGEGIEEYLEFENEMKVDFIDRGDGTVGVDPEWIELGNQDPGLWLATNWWWIFSDPGYGSSDTFGETGIPCDQWEDIRGWINQTVYNAVWNEISVGLAVTAAAIGCAGVAPTVLLYAACVGGDTVYSLYLAQHSYAAIETSRYWLDCYFDIVPPAPMPIEVDRPERANPTVQPTGYNGRSNGSLNRVGL